MSPDKSGSRRAGPARQLALPETPRRLRSSPRRIEVGLLKCSSEPIIFPVIRDGDGSGETRLSEDSGEGGCFFRQYTLNDIYLYPSEVATTYSSPLSRNDDIIQGYEKDAKVVITVTVEGSPGPIRTLVKLGTTVEDTIKLVIQKYGDEGRTPRLDKNSSSSFDLHVSYFSLQCLEWRNTIGEIGTRSFYLRKSNRKHIEEENSLEVANNSQIVPLQGSFCKQPGLPLVVLPSFITRKVDKFVRRMRRLFKLLGCLQSG